MQRFLGIAPCLNVSVDLEKKDKVFPKPS